MADDRDPIAPEDGPATRRDLTTAIAAAQRQTVEELTVVIRDVQTEIFKGLASVAKGTFARFNSLESNQSDIGIRMAALEERVLYLETRRPPQ
jgi:hypothetical protein